MYQSSDSLIQVEKVWFVLQASALLESSGQRVQKLGFILCGADMMTLNSEDSLLRNLARYQYLRNRHLTPTQDADDLFQDAWIQLNHSEIDSNGGQDEASEIKKLQKAVRRATDRAFGKLRKRCSRGNPSETTMQMEPADCIPDPDLVIDLRNLIQSLPLEERLVMELIRRGYEGAEIATLMKLSPQAVTRRKQKAVEKLRRRLDA